MSLVDWLPVATVAGARFMCKKKRERGANFCTGEKKNCKKKSGTKIAMTFRLCCQPISLQWSATANEVHKGEGGRRGADDPIMFLVEGGKSVFCKKETKIT